MVKDFPKDSGSSSDSSIYLGKIRTEEILQQEKLSELRAAAEEMFRRDFLRRAELESKACEQVDNILQLVEENEDCFTDSGKLQKNFYHFFKQFFDYFGLDLDFKTYKAIKEKEEKEHLLISIMKFLRDKLKKLVRAIFNSNLSWDQRLENEIKELEAKLNGGKLLEEEFARVCGRLEALRDLKLRLQTFLAGWVLTTLAECFSVELTASMETTKEEKRATEKAEKTSSKETKEVREDLAIKVGAKEKPTVIVPVSIFDFSSGVARLITLSKLERDLLLDFLKNLVCSVYKDDTNKENSGISKPKVKENKGATQPAQKPNLAERLTEVPKWQKVRTEHRRWFETDESKSEKMDVGSNAKSPRRGADVGLPPNPENFPKVDQFQVPSETNDDRKSGASAEREPQRSSVNNAQPPSGFDNVKVTKGQSVGKAPLKVR
ncbi:hypothetical protein IHO40_00930 [Wolbachia endosymbiont of Mansonella ozzardi]|uniref:hypothetical protein n=1 Tax=Wolbachia endosymbiont of Mansonella ozzardi TaxID=137464 RepID=UPI001CE21E05|nr:hypothetical protein [Wolbachia endosymbiont of Mansonella ozzardi]MCA4774738.1 hypothetical protein [Wolbachia endosymbiont of Mansonella ozzardi]